MLGNVNNFLLSGKLRSDLRRVWYGSPKFYNFNVRQFMQFSLFWSYSLLFLFTSIYVFLGITSCSGGCIQLERESIGVKRRQNKREWHELPYTEVVKSRTITIDLNLQILKVISYMYNDFYEKKNSCSYLIFSRSDQQHSSVKQCMF